MDQQVQMLHPPDASMGKGHAPRGSRGARGVGGLEMLHDSGIGFEASFCCSYWSTGGEWLHAVVLTVRSRSPMTWPAVRSTWG